MELLTTLIVLIGGMLLYGRLVAALTGAAFETLSTGFVAYREAGWPRGVQESEPVPWKWSSIPQQFVAGADPEPAPVPMIEVIEIAGRSEAKLTPIHRAEISGGTSSRRR